MKEQPIYYQDHRGVIRSMSAAKYEERRISEQSNENSGNGVSPPRREIISETPLSVQRVETTEDQPKNRQLQSLYGMV